jgi:hypothetical protein
MAGTVPRRTLEIFTLAECRGCETARDLANLARAHAPADLDVRLVDLAAAGAARPAAVFAVPTYLLDGRVLSLGNPDPAWLLAQLSTSADPRPLTPDRHPEGTRPEVP